MEVTLFSIGHGNKSIQEFLDELQSFGISYLVDVRSVPFSKWNPQFNQEMLQMDLKSHSITYVYMGNVIGGKPSDSECFDSKGFFDYNKMAKNPAFVSGLARLADAQSKSLKLAVMCSEADPSECHRSKLIGRELYDKYSINMRHIIGVKEEISEAKVIENLSNGAWSPNPTLFGVEPMPTFKSKKSYQNQLEAVEDYV